MANSHRGPPNNNYTNKIVKYDIATGYSNITDDVGPVETGVTHNFNVFAESRQGGVNPSYKEDIRALRDATTSLSLDKYYCDMQVGNAHIRLKRRSTKKMSVYGRWGQLVYITGIPAPLPASASKAYNQAKSKFIKKAVAKTRTFQGGVFVGELREAIDMIRRPAKLLRDGLGAYMNHAVRYGVHATPKRRVGVVADLWLEYQYGWGPLVSDMEAGAHALANVVTGRPDVYHIKARGSDTVAENYGDPEYSMSLNGTTQWTWGTAKQTVASCQFTGAIKSSTDVGVPDIRGRARDLGVSLGDFLPTVWELIPYSFLVDYFANVGQIIDALSVQQGDFVYISLAQKTETTQTVANVRFVPYNAGATYDKEYEAFLPGSFIHRRVSLTRGRFNGTLLPSLQWTLPKSVTKWVNIAALGHQNVNGVGKLYSRR